MHQRMQQSNSMITGPSCLHNRKVGASNERRKHAIEKKNVHCKRLTPVRGCHKVCSSMVEPNTGSALQPPMFCMGSSLGSSGSARETCDNISLTRRSEIWYQQRLGVKRSPPLTTIPVFVRTAQVDHCSCYNKLGHSRLRTFLRPKR